MYHVSVNFYTEDYENWWVLYSSANLNDVLCFVAKFYALGIDKPCDLQINYDRKNIMKTIL